MLIQTVFVSYILLSTVFHINHAFYLSLHALEWLNASHYCQSYCNSELASIHSQDDHLQTLDLIDHNPYIYTRVWIGLNDIQQSDIWKWSDGSNFNFGNDKDNLGRIIQGTYPWRSDEPDYDDADQAVALQVGNQFTETNTRKWIDRNSLSNYHFFCNDCSGKIHKYVILNEFSNQETAQQTCQDILGTSLASIHSQEDMTEAINICKEITSSIGCWIGLNDINESRQYEWTDGTQWDWGREFSKYPWFESEPGTIQNPPQNCIFMDPINGNDPGEYLWDDQYCVIGKQLPMTLCNAPSEICNSKDWVIIKGNRNNWQWNTKPCNVIKTIEFESVAVLTTKQYLNTDGVLKIDMMYTILHTSNESNTNAGIVLYINCNTYYYIGINTKESNIFIGKYNNNIFTLITAENISTFNLETQYLLSIELKHGIEWNILLNKQPMIQLIDDEFSNENNLLSGYIGVKNVQVEMSIKYLYISGQVQYEDNNIWDNTCVNQPTFDPIQPTEIPSKSPTKDPTGAPTTFPTLYPTNYPSNNPSHNPSDTPTNFPTSATNPSSLNASANPSISPTSNPSVTPSKNPTEIPSESPTTKNPTKLPTESPTPTIFPTKNPTKFSTKTPTNSPSMRPIFFIEREGNNLAATEKQKNGESYFVITSWAVVVFFLVGIGGVSVFCIVKAKKKKENETDTLPDTIEPGSPIEPDSALEPDSEIIDDYLNMRKIWM